MSQEPKLHKPKLHKIGVFAKMAGTNLRTLRYYEEVGLFQPVERSQGGFRYYRETDVNRLNLIRSLQELGLSLEAIRELLQTREDGISREEFVRRVESALSAQDALLEERIRSLHESMNAVRDLQDQMREQDERHHQMTRSTRARLVWFTLNVARSRARGHAARPVLRHQFDLYAQPSRHPVGPALTHQYGANIE